MFLGRVLSCHRKPSPKLLNLLDAQDVNRQIQGPGLRFATNRPCWKILRIPCTSVSTVEKLVHRVDISYMYDIYIYKFTPTVLSFVVCSLQIKRNRSRNIRGIIVIPQRQVMCVVCPPLHTAVLVQYIHRVIQGWVGLYTFSVIGDPCTPYPTKACVTLSVVDVEKGPCCHRVQWMIQNTAFL